MNVLPVIAAWLEEQGYIREEALSRPPHGLDLRPSRKVLGEWIKSRFGTLCDTDERVYLMTDAMIAAGIGREEEQGGTVYCRVTY